MKKILLACMIIFPVYCFTSCDSLLDEQPVSEIPAAEMWKTARDAKAGSVRFMGFSENHA